MFTVKQIFADGREHLWSARTVRKEGAKLVLEGVDSGIDGLKPISMDVGRKENEPKTRVFVMNDQGATVANYVI
jgi:hypothetical protein